MKTLKSGTCFNCNKEIGYKLDMCEDCARTLKNEIEADMMIEDRMMEV